MYFELRRAEDIEAENFRNLSFIHDRVFIRLFCPNEMEQTISVDTIRERTLDSAEYYVLSITREAIFHYARGNKSC